MKDGVISRFHIEDSTGMQLGLKSVDKEEKARINKLYSKWKKRNNQ